MDDLSFYNPEGSELRKTQMRMLEMLDVFDGICRRHNINYWLVCGTLLGAKRHGGFIPWDDDLDVAILQSDYKKVVSILKEELPGDLKLQARGTDKHYWYYYPRIRDTKSRYYNKNKKDNYEYTGIFIDIFPIEPVPSIAFKKKVEKILLYSDINFKTAKSLYGKIKLGASICALPFVRFFITLIRFYYKHMSHKKIYTYAFGIFFTVQYNMEYFFPASEIMFEGKKYKVPSKIDQHLINAFGPDFMEIPKPSDRATHAAKIEFL